MRNDAVTHQTSIHVEELAVVLRTRSRWQADVAMQAQAGSAVVDVQAVGEEIFADKIGVMLARSCQAGVDWMMVYMPRTPDPADGVNVGCMRVGCGPDVLGVVDPVPIVIKAGAGDTADTQIMSCCASGTRPLTRGTAARSGKKSA